MGTGCLHIKFVIVSPPFLPLTVKLISSGQTVRKTLDVLLNLVTVVMGKLSAIYSSVYSIKFFIYGEHCFI